MADVNCLRCGEPWDTYHLKYDVMPEEIEGNVLCEPAPTDGRPDTRDIYVFGKKADGSDNRLVVKRCPCCEDVLERTDGVPLGGAEKAAERAAFMEGVADPLDDDDDGLAALYEDAGLDR
jgi:hypothetical protein